MKKKWKPEILTPSPGLLAIVISPAESHLMGALRKKLESAFGPVDYESPVIKKDALSAGLSFIADTPGFEESFPLSGGTTFLTLGFRRPVLREEITDIKKQLLGILSGFQDNGKLLLDADALCITEMSIVRPVLTEKKHTVYLYGGIHAENLFYFEKLTYVPWPHTQYPYRMKQVIQTLNDLRMIYVLDKK